jgi:hypothetical protein
MGISATGTMSPPYGARALYYLVSIVVVRFISKYWSWVKLTATACGARVVVGRQIHILIYTAQVVFASYISAGMISDNERN